MLMFGVNLYMYVYIYIYIMYIYIYVCVYIHIFSSSWDRHSSQAWALHLSRNLSSSTITTMSKVLHLPRNLHFEVKPLLSRKVDFGAPKHEVSHAPATISDHHVRKCARRHNESAVVRSTRRGQADFVGLRSRNALRGLRESWMHYKQQRISRTRPRGTPI